jgi:4-hydroxybenzoate polyprenyltransferase
MKWLQLIRVPIVPTTVGNILAGYLIANRNWSDWPVLLCLITSSIALYCCGMILNDVFDAAQDEADQPDRPIPSGRVDLATATMLGWSLMALGILAAVLAGALSSPQAMAQCGSIAVLLSLAIYLYDGPLKQTPLAPVLMGVCRSLNVLLGGSTVSAAALAEQNRFSFFGFPLELWWAAIAIGVLIMGVTLLARNESRSVQARGKLVAAAGVMLTGFLLLTTLAWSPSAQFSRSALQTYPVLVVLVSLASIRRIVVCVADLQPRSVKLAIISTLRSLIIFDASICFLARPDNLLFALVVVALILPVLFLSKWIYST